MRPGSAATATLAALALPATFAAPPAAAASQHTVFTVALAYVPSQVTIAAGDSLVLTNLERPLHNVIALDHKQGGQPYFASATIGFGRTVQVAGVSALEPSDYPFVCTVHPEMTGVLLVR